MSFETSKWNVSEPFVEKFSVCLKSLSKKEVQRSWGRNVLGIFLKHQGSQFGRKWMRQKVVGNKAGDCGRLKSFFSKGFKKESKERFGPGLQVSPPWWLFNTPSFSNSDLLSPSPNVVFTDLFNLQHQRSLLFPQNIPSSSEWMKSQLHRVLCKFCHLWPQLDANTQSTYSGPCWICRVRRMSISPMVGRRWRAGGQLGAFQLLFVLSISRAGSGLCLCLKTNTSHLYDVVFGFLFYPVPGLANCGQWTHSHRPVFYKVLLAYSYTQLYKYWQWLPLHYRAERLQQGLYSLQSLRYLLYGSLQKMFTQPLICIAYERNVYFF